MAAGSPWVHGHLWLVSPQLGWDTNGSSQLCIVPVQEELCLHRGGSMQVGLQTPPGKGRQPCTLQAGCSGGSVRPRCLEGLGRRTGGRGIAL